MSQPIEKIIGVCQDRIADRLWEMNDELKVGDSPIEKILFLALFGCVKFTLTEFGDVRLSETGDHARLHAPRQRDCLYVTPQAPVQQYRLDFLVEVFDGEGWLKLAVECDGHDFHEKTKKQAARDKARDRIIVTEGYTLFRFTGSEIYADPMKCAEQIVDWAERNYWRRG